ncbi:MAG: hypothetical protein U0441_01305 [Polyangiaceae bacterium]
MNPGGNGGGYGPPGGQGPFGGNGPTRGYGPSPGGYGPSGTVPGGPGVGSGPTLPDPYSPPGWRAPNGQFAPMPANFPPGYTPETDTAALQGGIPWEQKSGSLLARWWDTVKAANSQPRPFFAACAQNEKGEAILFAMVSGLLGGALFGLFYIVIMIAVSAGLMLGLPHAGRGAHGAEMFAAGITVGLGVFYAITFTIFGAVAAVVRAFLWGGVHHLVLMLFGGVGQGRSFMHTVRALSYAEGAAIPWACIPIVGPFIALFYAIRNVAIGYDEAHRSGIGRALLAVFSPAMCCCCCMGFFALLGTPGILP